MGANEIRGKGRSLCLVIRALMSAPATSKTISLDNDICAESVDHSLMLLREFGLARKSCFELRRHVEPGGVYRPGKKPIIWAWNSIPFERGDFSECEKVVGEMQIEKRAPRPQTKEREKLIELASRKCGVLVSELAEVLKISPAHAASYCNTAGRYNHIIGMKRKGSRMRYFVSREDGAAWAADGAGPLLVAIGERIKSSARQPGPQLQRERAPQGHGWRPDAHTAGASKMAASAPSAALAPTAVGPAPKLWGTPRYAVDPATVPATFSGRLGCDPMTGQPWGVAA